MKSICLIGFMGSGKTTIGKELAKALQVRYFDTDLEIERWKERKIPLIFEIEGENAFRTYEKEMLQRMPNENAVIATGGGIVENSDNRATLRNCFFVIHLNPTFEDIEDRLRNDETRPLWNQDRDAKLKLFHYRKNLYVECADIVIDIHKQTVAQTVENILHSIKSLRFGDNN
ncbi:shikimate kinase [Salirhabdus sp. Marseille-P4669]|uniref:shikimate kinase n=1 Tax=Salirhabdus sp. Marseille-P4669 TaxID=2042310 RepID=UPI000C7CE451|nr:shikimate kinase [Salirhabdus sp. Marseille-P4669]